MTRRKTKKQQSLASIIVLSFMVIFTSSVGVFLYSQVKVLNELKVQEANLLDKIKEQENENVQLQTKQDYYVSDAYIEKIAREQLGLVKPDEIVFKNREQ